jgi:hypothetical protein
MTRTQRERQAEAIIESQFPLPSSIDCKGLVDTNALMNAEKTLLSNEVLVKRGSERKMAEAKLSALSAQRKVLDEIYIFKRCRELEQIDIEKKQLDAISAIRDDDKSLDTRTFDDRTLFVVFGVTAVALAMAYFLRKRG